MLDVVFEEADLPEPPQQDSLHRTPFFHEAALLIEKLSLFLGAGRVENDLLVRVGGAEVDGRFNEARPDTSSTMLGVHKPAWNGDLRVKVDLPKAG